MKLVVAVDNNWGIGYKGELLARVKNDLRHFRDLTAGKTVILGSTTLSTFPNGKPLKNRTNIVLYPGGEQRDDCIIVQNLEELKEELKKYNPDDVFIIGGAMFYRTMLPYCSEVLVTKVDADGGAEVFYENLDKLDNWKCISSQEPVETNGYSITFTIYKNDNVLEF